MRFECSICHKPGAPRVAGDATSCAPCHPLGGSALHVANGHQSCVSCHEPHTWTVAAASCAASGCHEGTVAGYLEENLPAFGGVLSTMSGLPVEAR
jgi:hypothetical protein